MGLYEIPDRLAEPCAQAALVGTAGAGRHAVHIAPDVLVGRLRPLRHQVDPPAALVVVLRHREDRVVHRRLAARLHDMSQVVRQAVAVAEGALLLARLVVEDDANAGMEVADDLQPVQDQVPVQCGLRKDLRVRPEEHGGARAARRADLTHGGHRLAPLEPLLPQVAVPLRRGDQLLRQRVDHAGADAVQAAGGAIGPVLEFPAGMERREDHLQRARAALGMAVHGHPAAVVGDGHGRPVGVQRHLHVLGVAVHRLVHRVVEDLPNKVVQAGRPDAADVHAGALADRLQSVEDGYVPGRISFCHLQLRRRPAGRRAPPERRDCNGSV